MPFVFASGAEFTDSEKSGAARINEMFSIARRNVSTLFFHLNMQYQTSVQFLFQQRILWWCLAFLLGFKTQSLSRRKHTAVVLIESYITNISF